MTASSRDLTETLARLRKDIEELAVSLGQSELSSRIRKTVETEVESLSERLSEIHEELDPIHQPTAVFDPSSPKTIGRFISIAMIAQEMVPLANVEQFYGSGIYAIYYKGCFSLYEPLAGAETPIYLGKADPATSIAEDPREQECRLARRLGDHRKNITRAESTLDINDFYCRWLVVSSGWESAAEAYMINLFKPIWNKEIKVIVGFGKHGDSAETRSNRRSPWDTLHPARTWAMDATLEDRKSIEQIQEEVAKHFELHPVFSDRSAILEGFFNELRQLKGI
jgi:Eco29kI restriction endonuclease